MGSLRTVLVPLVAIPVSLIGAVFLMQVFGFTLNLLTLLAIVLSVGLVVDDAIVVVENVERHIREGKTPIEAAFVGARELVGPIIAMTITLAAVYAPIGFQGGLTGALFREFAFTLAGAVFISGVVALTLSPMMSSRLLTAEHEPAASPRQIDRGFEAIKRAYVRALDAHARLARAWSTRCGSCSRSARRPDVHVLAAGARAERRSRRRVRRDRRARERDARAGRRPTRRRSSTTSRARPSSTHSFQITFATGGFGGMLVKPWDERKRSIFPIQEELGAKLTKITGMRAPVFLPSALPSAGFFPGRVRDRDHGEPRGAAALRPTRSPTTR